MEVIIIQGLESNSLVAQGYSGGSIYDETMVGGVNVMGWSASSFTESHLGWKCEALAKYIPATYVQPKGDYSRRGAILPGITICDQGLYSKLVKGK